MKDADEDRGRYVIVRLTENGSTEVVSAFEHRHWALKNDTAGFYTELLRRHRDAYNGKGRYAVAKLILMEDPA